MVHCLHCHQDVHVSEDTKSTQGHCHHKDHEHEEKKDVDLLGILFGTLLVGGAVVALPCLALTVMGFGTAGIVGGSVAAATQSAIGNVVAGSAFAVIQSAGATGTLMAGATGGLTVGAAGAVAGAVHNHNKKQEKDGDDGKENSGTNEKKGPGTTMKCNHCGQEYTVSQ